MGIRRNDIVLCVCRHCGFITYGTLEVAEECMRRHLVRKHGIGYTKVLPWRRHYITLKLSEEQIRILYSPLRKYLFRSIRAVVRDR